MNRLLAIAFGFLAIFAGKSLANDRFCAQIPIAYRLFNNTDSIESDQKPVSDGLEWKNRVLHRYCDNIQIIDFSMPYAYHHLSIILYSDDKNQPNFFKNDKYGEKFLLTNPLNPRDVGMNISLVPEIKNMSREDAEKYHMYPAAITRQNLQKTMVLNGEVKKYIRIIGEFPTPTGKIEREEVRLVPGWTTPLKGKEILSQTLVPGPNSILKEQRVYVAANWLNISRQPDSFHATALLEDDTKFAAYENYITVMDRIPLFKPTPVEIRLPHPGKTGKTVYTQARLDPGWFTELEEVSKQTLTFLDPQHTPQVMNVTVYPEVNLVDPKNGAIASYPLNAGNRLITVYYTGQNPEHNPDNRKGMFRRVEIVKQAGQNFPGNRVDLSPGWYDLLDTTVDATVIADIENREKSPFHGKEVTVTPGWAEFKDNSGFTAFYINEDVRLPVSVHLKSTPKYF